MPTCSLSSYLAASAKSGVTLFRQIVTLIGNPCNVHVNDMGERKNSSVIMTSLYCLRAFRATPGRPQKKLTRVIMTSGVSECPLAETPKVGMSRDIHGLQLVQNIPEKLLWRQTMPFKLVSSSINSLLRHQNLMKILTKVSYIKASLF